MISLLKCVGIPHYDLVIYVNCLHVVIWESSHRVCVFRSAFVAVLSSQLVPCWVVEVLVYNAYSFTSLGTSSHTTTPRNLSGRDLLLYAHGPTSAAPS